MPFPFIAGRAIFLYDKAMSELIYWLKFLGLTDAERAAILEYFNGDLDGLKAYVLYLVAEIGDANEYLD